MIETVNMPAPRIIRLFARSRLMDMTMTLYPPPAARVHRRDLCGESAKDECLVGGRLASHPTYRLNMPPGLGLQQEALSITWRLLSLLRLL